VVYSLIFCVYSTSVAIFGSRTKLCVCCAATGCCTIAAVATSASTAYFFMEASQNDPLCYRTRSLPIPRNRFILLIAMTIAAAAVSAQRPDEKSALTQRIDARRDHYASVAKEIWGFAEVGYQEVKSSALLQQELKAAGFQVRAGVADI